MPVAERQAIIRDYVQEEALYRDALALKLDRSDYVVRRRLVQTMKYLVESEIAAAPQTPDEAQLAAYYAAHRERYSVPAQLTFTHIFFDGARGTDVARRRALETLAQLNTAAGKSEQTRQRGDRFPYYANYTGESQELVTAHFGPAMADQLFRAAPDSTHWQGPLVSRLGVHLVLLSARTPARNPELQEIRAALTADWQRDTTQAALASRLRAMLASYRVESVIK